jgi:hypothetical protein
MRPAIEPGTPPPSPFIALLEASDIALPISPTATGLICWTCEDILKLVCTVEVVVIVSMLGAFTVGCSGVKTSFTTSVGSSGGAAAASSPTIPPPCASKSGGSTYALKSTTLPPRITMIACSRSETERKRDAAIFSCSFFVKDLFWEASSMTIERIRLVNEIVNVAGTRRRTDRAGEGQGAGQKKNAAPGGPDAASARSGAAYLLIGM